MSKKKVKKVRVRPLVSSGQERRLGVQLRAFRNEHTSINKRGLVAPMTWEALGRVAPIAMMTLYRIATGSVMHPTAATCIVTREFMAQHKCKAAARCHNCDKRRSRRRAS